MWTLRYTNWLLFSATIETFLMKAGAGSDNYRINSALRKVEEWYVGDGWYSDGPSFAFDYYNSYVLHPMYVECLEVVTDKKQNWIAPRKRYETAVKRMQRFGMILERFISPEGTFPVFGVPLPIVQVCCSLWLCLLCVKNCPNLCLTGRFVQL